jgi:4-coumarate--CoA ligase
MVFQSSFSVTHRPNTDVFTYIFHQGRRDYPRCRVIYRSADTNEKLSLRALEDKARRLSDVFANIYKIKPGDVIALLAADSVG